MLGTDLQLQLTDSFRGFRIDLVEVTRPRSRNLSTLGDARMDLERGLLSLQRAYCYLH